MTRLTHAAGAPVVDNFNIQTAGRRGPAVLQDVWLLEKLAHFDREVIPERRMHAKGAGAHGHFTVTQDITAFTRAALFAAVGKRCEVFVRFSTVAGERGAADAERDIRGFAIKFYTEQGNWDLVGNNTPVFFLRDPLRFPDLNHAVKRDPRTGLRSAASNWDFWTLLPEALHQVTYVMGDRGLPRSYRHMHGFGSHTFSLINAAGVRHWVKFSWKTQQGIANLTDEEAQAVVGSDRESAQRDLYQAIEAGDFPRWTLYLQTMTEGEAARHPVNPFDLTKVWPHGDFPLREVGVLELNRNPTNFFAEVEQAAFSPAQIVPGIGFSPDRMLQARLFSYGDAQCYPQVFEGEVAQGQDGACVHAVVAEGRGQPRSSQPSAAGTPSARGSASPTSWPSSAPRRRSSIAPKWCNRTRPCRSSTTRLGVPRRRRACMLKGTPSWPSGWSMPIGKLSRYSCTKARSAATLPITVWCSNTVCRPTTASCPGGNSWCRRCACGSPCDTQPGQSSWKACSTTTRPRSDASVMGAGVLSQCATCRAGAGSGVALSMAQAPWRCRRTAGKSTGTSKTRFT